MIYIFITILVFLLDYLIKRYIDRKRDYNRTEEILNGKLFIRKTYNQGAFLNFMEKRPRLITFLSILLFVFLCLFFFPFFFKKGNVLIKLGGSLLIGGAASNIADRLLKKHVIDYFSFPFKKIRRIVFNLADIFIFLGALLAFFGILKMK
jgi:signal peptidase II